MNSAASSSLAFDSWAEVYDDQPNALLALEQRFLSRMLPNLRGLDVLDAGCGTGRWLQHLASRLPASLLGVDTSPEMLRRAEAKLGTSSILRLGSCTALPVQDATIDFALASFVLSYLPDVEIFARELDRVTRSGATIFLTDMHPDTAAACNWKRSFKKDHRETTLETSGWPLSRITQAFQVLGFEILSLIEPAFDTTEKQIFAELEKLDLFESAAILPAIYMLQLRKPQLTKIETNLLSVPTASTRLTGARLAVGPDAITPASVAIDHGYIHSMTSRPWLDDTYSNSDTASTVDLTGYFLLPGLINAHDHLEFSLFPNLGNGPYQNSIQWASDIHRTQVSTITQHCSVSKPTRLLWGAIRNLLCGVTTVCHHNPVSPDLLDPAFPVRVLADFGWAHSLPFARKLATDFEQTPPDLPFILHAGEGVDEMSARDVFDLDRMGILDERTVLVHGLALAPEAISLLNRRGAALIICPTSNQFLFNVSLSSASIHSLKTVVLGSDSPLTAAGDLLDEIRFAHTRIGLEADILYDMVTTRAGEVLRLRNGEGRLIPGSIADIIAVPDAGRSPAETLAQLTLAQVELVILSGRVQLASRCLFERLPEALRDGLQPLDIDGLQRWVRAPINTMLAEARRVLGNNIQLGGKRVNHVTAA
jgi:cytosine/adenosine deaminase-related metal-dependent hydrolase/ubiquinone/menaquinone biosynthesis C-methylase UbiE